MDRVRKRIGFEDIKEYKCMGKSTTVAVLDSGMAPHPDLQGKCICFKDFVNHKNIVYDDNGHGTHVCGILCGSGEASQGKYRGVAPSTRLVLCKVLDKKGDGCAEIMIEALNWLKENHKRYDIRIVNISVGVGRMHDKEKSILLNQTLEELWEEGLVIICAAGNKGPKPGSISNIGGLQKIITVGCYDDLEEHYGSNNCDKYSGRGPLSDTFRKPDLVAPGTGIVSCNHLFQRLNSKDKEKLKADTTPAKYYKNLYVAQSGTSMATPMVSGAAALLLQKKPWLSNEKISQRIKMSAEDLGEAWNRQGWGMLNVKNILEIH